MWDTASRRSNRSATASRPTDPMLGRLVHFLRRSIARKLTLTLVGFVAVTTLLAGLYLNRALEAFAVDTLEAHLASTGRLLHDEARAVLARGAAAGDAGAFGVRVPAPPVSRVTPVAPDRDVARAPEGGPDGPARVGTPARRPH